MGGLLVVMTVSTYTTVVIILSFVVGYVLVSLAYSVARHISSKFRSATSEESSSKEDVGDGTQSEFSEQDHSNDYSCGDDDFTENSNSYSRNQYRTDRSYYEAVLGLPGYYSVDDLRRHYHALASKYHPDKVSHLGAKLQDLANREMKIINEAYQYLLKYKRAMGE